MLDVKRTLHPVGRVACALGTATISAWLMSGYPEPFEHIRTGLEVLQFSAGGALDDFAVGEFFRGGYDHLASIGLGLSDRARDLGINLSGSVTSSLMEMRLHAGDRAADLVGAFNDKIAGSQDFAAYWAQASGLAKSEESALRLIDAGKGLAEVIHGIAKAWTIYTVASRAIRWGIGKARDALEGAPEGGPDLEAGIEGGPTIHCSRAAADTDAPEHPGDEGLGDRAETECEAACSQHEGPEMRP